MTKTDITIILPVYNEKDVIASVLKEWDRVLQRLKLRYVFIICEDGSTDGTQNELKKLQHQFSIVLNQKTYRRGYGPSVIDGIVASTSEFILCIDSDGQCDPEDFSQFWKNRNTKNVLIGWRMSRADVLSRKIYSKLFKQLFAFLFPRSPHDPSAPYVLFTKEIILPYISYLTFLKEGFWWGFVGTCIKYSIPIQELPVRHRARSFGKTRVYELEKIPHIALRNVFGLVKLKVVR